MHPHFFHRFRVGLVALAGGLLAIRAAAQDFELVHTLPTRGETPLAPLVKDDAGDFLGTTFGGGSAGFGTVFKVTPSGTFTTLVNFLGSNGTLPSGALIKGPDAKFYGLNYGGGARDRGTVFRVGSDGAFEVVAQFSGTDGGYPQGELARDEHGNFYGVAALGPGGQKGVIFKMTTEKALKVIAQFSGTNGQITQLSSSSVVPASGLIRGTDGNFYGTTPTGGDGNSDAGVAFKVTPAGALTVLAQFGGTNGTRPSSGLVQGSDENFYGTTALGGTSNGGTFFRLTSAGVLTTLASFASAVGTGPYGGLIEVGTGTFYGACRTGGSNGVGTFYKVTSAGMVTKLGDFDTTTKGSNPVTTLALGDDGDLYGTCRSSGAFFAGTVVKATTTGTITKIAEFGAGEGANLAAGVIAAPDGVLYGTTTLGGGNLSGLFYSLTTAGVWTKLADCIAATTGPASIFPLTLGIDGKLYGTSLPTASSLNGRIFTATTAGVLTKVVDFHGTDGRRANGVIQASDGAFYGTALAGGASDFGVIFRYSTMDGLQKLFDFGASTGTAPTSRLVEGRDGALYGTTQQGGAHGFGTIFRVTTTGAFTVLAQFSGTNGARPVGPLVLGVDGNFYGLTYSGGRYNNGVVYRVTPTGRLTALTHLNARTGAFPQGGLTVGPGGNLYGVTYLGGGVGKYGTVFKVTPKGKLTVLQTFDGETNGAYPLSTLTIGPGGDLYGTTYNTVFRLVTHNLPPVAVADSLTLPAFNVNVLKNDSDPNHDPIRLVSVTQGAHGSVEINADGSITYLPAADFTTADSFTYTITDTLGATATATVNVSLPLDLLRAGVGAYAGVLTVSGTARGYWGVVLTASGGLSGALIVDGVKTPVKGTFGADGMLQQVVLRTGFPSLTLTLQLDPARNQITGTVNDGTDTFDVDLVRTFPRFTAAHPTPAAGRYTLLFPLDAAQIGNAAIPQGTGYATMTVTPSGSVAVAGRLADDTPFSVGSFFTHDDHFPLYVPLYARKGFLVGLVEATDKPGSDARGVLTWQKPATTGTRYPSAFTTSTPMTGSRYAPTKPVLPLDPQANNAELVFRNLGITKTLTVSDANKVTVTNPGADAASVKIDAATGLFSGSYVTPADSVLRSFRGAIFQKDPLPRGEGYYLGVSDTDQVTLEKP